MAFLTLSSLDITASTAVVSGRGGVAGVFAEESRKARTSSVETSLT